MARKPAAVKPTPVALFVSDLHCAENAWDGRPEIRGDALWAFDWIVDQAIELKVKAIVAAGDILDTKRPPAKVVQTLRRGMAALAKNHIDFYFIEGQHDMSMPPWLSAISRWPQHVDEKPFELILDHGKLLCYGLDWRPPDQLVRALTEVPEETDLLVMHQVSELMGSIVTPELEFAQVPHASVLVIGDYHRRQTLEGKHVRNAQGQPLTVISPGSTAMQSIDEPPEKYALLLDSAGNFHDLPIPTRPMLSLELHDEVGLDQTAEQAESLVGHRIDLAKALGLPEGLQTPLVWIKYREDIPEAYSRLLQAYGRRSHLFLKPLMVEREEIVVERAKRNKLIAGGLVGCLELVVPKQDHLYGLARRLLDSQDPKQTLGEMREERHL